MHGRYERPVEPRGEVAQAIRWDRPPALHRRSPRHVASKGRISRPFVCSQHANDAVSRRRSSFMRHRLRRGARLPPASITCRLEAAQDRLESRRDGQRSAGEKLRQAQGRVDRGPARCFLAEPPHPGQSILLPSCITQTVSRPAPGRIHARPLIAESSPALNPVVPGRRPPANRTARRRGRRSR